MVMVLVLVLVFTFKKWFLFILLLLWKIKKLHFKGKHYIYCAVNVDFNKALNVRRAELWKIMTKIGMSVEY